MPISVNIHEAKSGLSGLLAQVAKDGRPVVICNRGKPVAEIGPHRARQRTVPHPRMGRIKISYDPIEPLQPDEWPTDVP